MKTFKDLKEGDTIYKVVYSDVYEYEHEHAEINELFR